MGYVGCANALMFAKNNDVTIVDNDKRKLSDLNNGVFPFNETLANDFYNKNSLRFSSASSIYDVTVFHDIFVLALPTDFDEVTGFFDTSIIELTIEAILTMHSNSLIVIRSTVYIGFTEKMQQQFNTQNIIFCPEFLREDSPLYDSLYPDRVVIGNLALKNNLFLSILKSCFINNPSILITSPGSAESIKLFSNTYLAMRVAFFNELDTFCFDQGINPHDVISGVSLDKRIGTLYNNPSFGFGGYCLPKDSKQLENLFHINNISNSLIKEINNSNKHRKKYISKKILEHNPKSVGIFYLGMKKDSKNFRQSAVLDIIYDLLNNGISIYVFDPYIDVTGMKEIKQLNSLDELAEISDIILANRVDSSLEPYKAKVISRDLFNSS